MHRFNVVTVTLLVAGCLAIGSLAAQAPQAPVPVPVTGIPTSSQAPPSSSVGTPPVGTSDSRYRVHNQDTLLLSFPLSPELNQSVTIQPDGFINLISAGSVHVAGLTVPQVMEAVRGAYAGILKNPIISVDLADFQKPFYTVSGQVGRPGQYELRAAVKISEAIAVAGGLAPTAKTQLFILHRTSDEWYEVTKLNLKAVLSGKDLDQDTLVQPGDMIVVPESAITKFRKYVPYTVNAGGYIPINF